MQPDYMRETLKNLQAIWGRPVCLATVQDEQPKLYRHDGSEIQEIAIGDPRAQEPGAASDD
jgi:spore cortex formation protein SpoVR/YcgB (stage V sporulation)